MNTIDTLLNAKVQIEYMQEKFQETGSGNAVINQLETKVSELEQKKKQLRKKISSYAIACMNVQQIAMEGKESAYFAVLRRDKAFEELEQFIDNEL